ncbi:MAG: thioredoxin [Pseudomonadota bacterium]
MKLIAVVKRDCDTCQLVEPVLADLVRRGEITIYSQDDPTFPETAGGALDDRDLTASWRLNIDTVPTLLRLQNDRESGRAEGWDRAQWATLCDLPSSATSLPAYQPGCGSLTQLPGVADQLALKYDGADFRSRRIDVGEWDDAVELMYDRGWSDGLPTVAPTALRVARMLAGTHRDRHELVGLIPPNLVECTVEKVAINAVLAGCRPEYFPVVLAAVEGALRPEFSMHGLLATLWFSGPVLIVNGPVTKRIGMNWAGNALGQGNRANATIGRALQLLIRNVGGGLPGGVDRSVLGNPGKYTFCFAEDETDPSWEPLNVARGATPGTSSVTLFHGDGVQGVSAQLSRSPDDLSRSLAMALGAVAHPKLAKWSHAILVLSPDHYDIYKNAGWGRADVEGSLVDALRRPSADLLRGVGGVAEGIEATEEAFVDKFHDGGLLVVRAGGRGGQLSAIIGGWSAQRRVKEVQIVTQEITE